MQTHWIEKQSKYDGKQLAPLYNYLTHGILGDSIVAWTGACDIPFDHMMDGEDLRESSKIQGEQMLHFVLELFQFPMSAAILLQRLMGEILIQKITQQTGGEFSLERKGDDVYWGTKKLNISIATCSSTSSLIHFGINITNEGTPVETAALSDFGIADVKAFADDYMETLKQEFMGVKRALVKVRVF